MVSESEWPAERDLVICTTTKVFAQGAFAKLDEYPGKEGMVHISEVASGWIKNIRSHVREGRKIIAKVLSVDQKKGHIDLSMRRVKETQRREKIKEWKLEQRARKILERAASDLGKDFSTAYKEVGPALRDEFGSLYSAFEAVSKKGKKIISDVLPDNNWVDAIAELSADIETPLVDVAGSIDLTCLTPQGVESIKSALIEAQNAIEDPEVNVELRYVGSPRYSIKISAPSYKIAGDALQKIAETAIASAKKAGGEGKFYPSRKK